MRNLFRVISLSSAISTRAFALEASFVLFPLALFLASNGCKHRDDIICNNNSGELATGTNRVAYVLMRAKLFLYVYEGEDAYKMYTDPDRPPKVSFVSEKKVWNVSFMYPGGPVTIQLDEKAEKANYMFLSGRVIKRAVDGKVDYGFPPLYTLEEMVELLELPHNHRK